MILLFGSIVQGIHLRVTNVSTVLAMYILFSLCILFLLVININATALMTQIGANEKLCFYTDVDKTGEKIDYIFVQVQSGGSFDIDYEVRDPGDKVILDGQQERQGDFVLSANVAGEYSFCFENDMSTLTEKLVDFDIMVESEPRREPPAKAGQISEHTSALEESIFRLTGILNSIKRLQKHFHTSENRGFSIVKSTQNRLFWYATFESLAVIGMAVSIFFKPFSRRRVVATRCNCASFPVIHLDFLYLY
ncbi:hypothetical protein Ac2012v2_007868 [Leucoagaricus gongylophorus]